MGVGTVEVRFTNWKGDLETWEVRGQQIVTPTSVWNEPIDLVAAPDPGYRFVEWTSTCTKEDLQGQSSEITIHSYRTNCVTAHFATSSAPPEPPDPGPEPPPEPPNCGCNKLHEMVGQEVVRLAQEYVEIEDGQELEFMRRLSRAFELLEPQAHTEAK
jgi:hypothetical protein